MCVCVCVYRKWNDKGGERENEDAYLAIHRKIEVCDETVVFAEFCFHQISVGHVVQVNAVVA